MKHRNFLFLFLALIVLLSPMTSMAEEVYVVRGEQKNIILADLLSDTITDSNSVKYKDTALIGQSESGVGGVSIFRKTGGVGPFKVGDQAYYYVENVISSPVQLIGVNSDMLFVAQATKGDLSRRYLIQTNQLYPMSGSLAGIAIGSEIDSFTLSKDQIPQFLKARVLTIIKENMFLAVTPSGDELSVPLQEIFKYQGCASSQLVHDFICVEHHYYNFAEGDYVKVKAFTESGWTIQNVENGKAQGLDRIAKATDLASGEAGRCTFKICTGEIYLNALDAYKEVKVIGITKDAKIYISAASDPFVPTQFAGSAAFLLKANEKKSNWNGISLGQKIILLQGTDLGEVATLVGISSDNQFAIESNGKKREYDSRQVARAEGCDEKTKICVGQHFSIPIEKGGDVHVKVDAFESNGLFVVSAPSNGNTYKDIDPKNFRRVGCSKGICQEKDFKYNSSTWDLF